jgi:hypothetical protein
MKKALVTILSVALLALPLLALTACGGGTQLSDNDIAVIRGLATRVDSLELKAAALENKIDSTNNVDLGGYVKQTDLPNLSNYVTDAELDNFIDNLTSDQVTALKEKLGITPSPIVPTSGKVAVEIADAWNCDFNETSLENIYSSGTLNSYRFTVEVTNGTDEYRYIYLSLVLSRDSVISPTPNILTGPGNTELICYTWGSSLTYTATATPSPNTTTVLFSPSTRFPVGKGKTIDVDFNLNIKDSGSATAIWFGDLTYSTSSTP